MRTYKYCECCGRRFEANRRDKRFCSVTCAQNARKDRLRTVKMLGLQATDLSGREVLTVELASIYIGVSRSTMYRWIAAGHVPSHTDSRQKMVRRRDLDTIFRNESPAEVDRNGRSLVSVSEAARSYGYSFSQCYRILNYEGVHFVRLGRTDYYDRAEVDAALTSRTVSGSFFISGWCTPEQIATIYGMTEKSVRTMVHNYGIPWKRFNRIRLYSVEHVEAARRSAKPSCEGLIPIQEAMERYGLTYHNIWMHAERHGISKLKIGGRIFLSRQELEAILGSSDFQL